MVHVPPAVPESQFKWTILIKCICVCALVSLHTERALLHNDATILSPEGREPSRLLDKARNLESGTPMLHV